MPFSLTTIVLLMAVGALAGVLAGLFGIGGGIILIPIFLAVFRLAGCDPDILVHLAFGTSLAIIIPTALSSTLGHRKRNNVAWRQILPMAWGSLAGAAIGSSLAAALPGTVLKGCFGLLQIGTGLSMLRRKRLPEGAEGGKRPPALSALVLTGLVVGGFSSFFGVGGGVIAVPLMSLLLHQPIHRAVGTSSALMVVSALAGTFSYVVHGWGDPRLPPFSLGYVNLLVVGLIAPATILCARLGVRLAQRLSRDKLLSAFAWFIIAVGLYMAAGALIR